MPSGDLREYIGLLEREGELKRVKAEVDWNLEMGAIGRRLVELKGPAPLFETVKGYPPGRFRAFTNTFGPSEDNVHGRVALAMGLRKDTPTLQIIDEFERRILEPIPPKLVDDGECKENILTGEEVDLLKFPIPLLRATDGGRYVGTWHIDVTKDPDSGWVNWGTYRHMLHGKAHIGLLAHRGQHGPSLYYEKYEERGEVMPWAIAIGTDPICNFVATSQFPRYVNEAEMAGAVKGGSIALVKCETIDLHVPASAELVLEGEVRPFERKSEGPFGEFVGYAASEQAPRPVIHIKCITYRNDPIFTFSQPGKPWDEFHVMTSISGSALLASELRRKGLPFKSIYVPPPATSVIVSAKPPYPAYAQTLASAIWSHKIGLYRPYIIVVGEDVDVARLEDVYWCLTTRLHPSRGIHVVDRAPCIPLMPFLTPKEREESGGYVSSKLLLDATFPAEWSSNQIPTTIDFEHAWPKEVCSRVLERWRDYGFR